MFHVVEEHGLKRIVANRKAGPYEIKSRDTTPSYLPSAPAGTQWCLFLPCAGYFPSL